MRVIAIDPGYDRCGIAVVEKGARGKDVLCYSDCVTTNREDDFARRLTTVIDAVRACINEHAPNAMALETLFFNSNQKTAMRVAEVRGSLIQTANDAGLRVHEYTPLQVKSAVAGNGHANKSDMMRMVPLLIALTPKKRLDDEYDAIAIGITHCASTKQVLLGK